MATRQYGVFSRRQVIALGVTVGKLRHRTQTGRWETLLPQVYRIGGTPSSPRQAAMAATLWAGEGCLLSHWTAAALWGLDHRHGSKVELWVPAGRSPTSENVIVHRGGRLDRADRTVLDGLPITTPTRTLIDIAGRSEDEALLAAMERAFREGLTTPERLGARITALRTSGRPGAGRLEQMLIDRHVDAAALESRLEARLWRILTRSALPSCLRQHWVVANGKRYRLDFAWPERRVAVECNGLAFHGRERFDRDGERTADLSSEGWLVIPVTWTHTSTPAVVVRRVERALRRFSAA